MSDSPKLAVDESLAVFLTALKRLALPGVLMVAVGLLPMLVYAASAASDFGRVASICAIAGAAAFVLGGLIGFLFGIPRMLSEESPERGHKALTSYRVNTNLEQISDWLTKILVGAGLVQISEIASTGRHVAAALAEGMGIPGDDGVVGAILIYFAGNGFISAYYLTRTTLTTAFIVSDASVRRIERRMNPAEDTDEMHPIVGQEIDSVNPPD
jgi:hypothetical protein